MKKQFILCLFVMGGVSANAMLITNLGGNTINSGPAERTPVVSNILDEYQARSQWINYTAGNDYQFVQTWRAPESFSMSEYCVQLSNVQNAIVDAGGATIRATVYSYSSASDYIPDSTLATFTGTTAAEFGSAATYEYYNWVSFEFDSPVAVAAGNYYGVFLEWTDASDTRYMNLNHSSGSSYSDGEMWRSPDSGANWWGYSSNDQAFAVIPEPATLGLMGVALSGVLLLRRSLS